MSELKLAVKQGEEINVGFTIKQGGNPMDLSNYTVRFEVKRSPLVTAKPIISKDITTVSDSNTIGIINSPTEGKFLVHLLSEDTSYPIGDYYLIIALVAPHTNDIISSGCCSGAKFKICEQ